MKKDIGIAVDVGTTTVALHLIELETGQKLAVSNGVNAQTVCGADVTARLKYCADNGYEELTKLIREQISSMIHDVCKKLGKNCDEIKHISIAGNTIMQHIAAGMSPVGMGASPFTTVSLFGEELPAWDNLPSAKNTSVYYTPAISAFVGGDITAGLLATGFDETDETVMFVDVGTNSEIVIKHAGTYYCAATAAGPAFEGAEIEKGMTADNGAIDHVWLNNVENIEHSVIGGGEPTGICGSGLLDALAVFLDTGIIDPSGRMNNAPMYTLSSDVYISAADIRKLQLAKAAIAAGIQILLHQAGIKETDVKSLVLAGGFGSFMDLKSAVKIGLFPKSLLPKAKALGNTAGEGVIKALCSNEARARLDKIREHSEYISLSATSFFNDMFVEQMAFPN